LPVHPAVATDLEPDVDEQPLALVSRLGRHARQPRSRVGQERLLHLVERELQLEVIPDEHGTEDAAGRGAPRGPKGLRRVGRKAQVEILAQSETSKHGWAKPSGNGAT